MSGCRSKVCDPNMWPVRPKPQITSSTTNRMSYFFRIGCTRSKYVAGGTITPPAPITGSAKNAATVSGPSRRISCSRFVGEPRRERLLALARLRAAIVVRAVGVQDARDRQVEIGVGEGEPGEARRWRS